MKEERPNYYSILPATVRYDKELTDKAKLLYSEITSLCNANGECWANNNYFAELYNTSTNNISKLIKILVDKKYLDRKIFYKEGSKEIEKRVLIPIGENYNTYWRKLQYPIGENYKENNTSINNKENNNINIIIKERKENTYKCFTKPTIQDIKLYCEERGNKIDAEYFFDYYESKGWKVGRNAPMKDWKAAIRLWEKNDKDKEISSKPLIEEVSEGVFKF